MSDRVERFSALAGPLAVLLWVGGVAMIGGGHVGLPGGIPEEGADDVLAHFRDNADAVVSGGWLFMLGSLAFLWFVGILRSRLVRAEGGAGTFASIAFAGGIATGVFALGMPAGGVVTALGVDQIGAAEAAALNALEAAFFIGAELSAIVLLAATAVAALRTAALPRWWAPPSILLAVWLVIGPIGWIGLLAGLPVWTLVTSVMLIRPGAPHAEMAERTERVSGTVHKDEGVVEDGAEAVIPPKGGRLVHDHMGTDRSARS